jgi:1-deoxy-D-xylulose-5-phosphate reductoisomerase
MKNIAIIGSTGSIGRQTLEVIESDPAHYKVSALACNSDIALLEKQIRKFKPSLVAVFNRAAASSLKKRLALGSGARTLADVRVVSGVAGLNELAVMKKTDTVMFAASGLESLPALHAAIKAHKQIALANKELLVCEGPQIMAAALRNRVTIIPVDSEHSAIFQCLRGEKIEEVEKIILTCSGGPFFGRSQKQLKNVTVAQALTHPVWKMGKEISIDSATLMNKAFEIIEAAYLFNLKPEQIEVVIHPEGIVHSLVQFKDGSIKAQLSAPDMRFPIAYALAYPRRIKTDFPNADLAALSKLTFYKPDHSTFKGPALAYAALKKGGKHPRLLFAANGIVRQKFLKGRISFDSVYPEIEKIIAKKSRA